MQQRFSVNDIHYLSGVHLFLADIPDFYKGLNTVLEEIIS